MLLQQSLSGKMGGEFFYNLVSRLLKYISIFARCFLGEAAIGFV
jgi:hypothetical protein